MLITPAVRSLAYAWPSAQIDFLGSTTSAEVFRYLPFVTRVSSTTKKRIRFKGWLGKQKYDLALVYGYDGDGPFVRYALRVAKEVIAFTQKDVSLNKRLLASVEKPPYQSCHSVDHFLSLIGPLGISIAGKQLAYVVSMEEQHKAKLALAKLRESHPCVPLIGLQIASYPTKAFRDWPLGNFLELCRIILKSRPTAHFLIFGGPLERNRTGWLADQLGQYATHLAGTLSLRQTAALMNEIDLYIGVDTGPTHIVGALGRPMVAMYHGSSPSWLLAPLERPLLYVVDHPRAGHVGPEAAMADISVDRVWQAVEQALATPPAP
jgi:heptosyltransferase-3